MAALLYCSLVQHLSWKLWCSQPTSCDLNTSTSGSHWSCDLLISIKLKLQLQQCISSVSVYVCVLIDWTGCGCWGRCTDWTVWNWVSVCLINMMNGWIVWMLLGFPSYAICLDTYWWLGISTLFKWKVSMFKLSLNGKFQCQIHNPYYYNYFISIKITK